MVSSTFTFRSAGATGFHGPLLCALCDQHFGALIELMPTILTAPESQSTVNHSFHFGSPIYSAVLTYFYLFYPWRTIQSIDFGRVGSPVEPSLQTIGIPNIESAAHANTTLL